MTSHLLKLGFFLYKSRIIKIKNNIKIHLRQIVTKRKTIEVYQTNLPVFKYC